MIPSSAADDRVKLLGFVTANPGFHLPEDVRTPIVMIGVGSGIAPFRAFWQERLVRAKASLRSLTLHSSVTDASRVLVCCGAPPLEI